VHVVDDLAYQRALSRPDSALWSEPFAPTETTVPGTLQPLLELQQVLEVAAWLPTAPDTIVEIGEWLARRGEFIESRGLAEWPDDTESGRHGFRHALHQGVLYRRLGSTRRVRLHRLIGECEAGGYGGRVWRAGQRACGGAGGAL
jgi:hypothetical protein